MRVILCHPADDAALWLDRALRSLGVAGLELVAVEQLVYSRRIVHRMDNAGDAGEIRLQDGRVLYPERVSALVNRIRHLPTAHFDAAPPSERAYAIEELNAFLLAWLDCIPGPVINRPLPSMLGGGDPAPAVLHHHAAVAGLATQPWTGDSRFAQPDAPAPATHRVIVFDHRVFGPILPRELQEACRHLAVLLGLAIVEIGLIRHRHGWSFQDASGSVDFRHGGTALVSAIAQVLDRSAP